MTDHYFAAQLFDGTQWHKHVAFSVEDGLVVDFRPDSDSTGTVLPGIVSAGLVDIQVNGGGGMLFNQQPNSDCLKAMINGHSRYGTTSMLPTLITDELSVMQQAADAIAEAIATSLPGIVGVHFEGPHLSVPKRGIHPQHCVRPISDAELALFTRQDLGQVMLTLAPENVSPDVIRDLTQRGIKICLGHSNADADTVMAALDAGASGFTHLYNAMSGLTGRAPGMLGAALLRDDAWCGLIVDKHHVSDLACQLAYKTKGVERLILVTDAMAHVGSELQNMPYLDTEILRDGDKLTLPNGTLAGSALDMASAVRNMHQLGVPLEDALQMASATPAQFLGFDSIGHLAKGKRADFTLFSQDLHVTHTWIGGTQMFDCSANR